MWLFTKGGAVSVVADRDNRDRMIVRARRAAHLRNVIGRGFDYDITVLDEADYRYRVVLTRDEARKMLTEVIGGLDYPNFKGEVDKRADRYLIEREYADGLHDIWAVYKEAMDEGRE